MKQEPNSNPGPAQICVSFGERPHNCPQSVTVLPHRTGLRLPGSCYNTFLTETQRQIFLRFTFYVLRLTFDTQRVFTQSNNVHAQPDYTPLLRLLRSLAERV